MPSYFPYWQHDTSDKKSFLNKHYKGFSLVELMIVIATMVLIFGTGYANYRSFQRRQHLESAVRMVTADLRLAQEMALAGRKPQEPVGNNCVTNVLGGYVFWRNQASPAQYSIYAVCPNWANRVLVKGPIDMPEDVTLVVPVAGDRFRFNVLARGTNQNSNVVLTVGFVGSGVTNQTITVTPAGNIF